MRSVYSVPYRYVHRQVRVKYSDTLVIILDSDSMESIATHRRVPAYQHAIEESHLPPAKIQLKSFNVIKVQKFADGIGENTRAYVDWQFSLDDPLRALRRMLGLMRFYENEHPSAEAMESAAKNAKAFEKRHLRYFESCVQNYSPTSARLHLVTPPTRELAYIHVRNNDKGE
jgi:hypothetical protein